MCFSNVLKERYQHFLIFFDCCWSLAVSQDSLGSDGAAFDNFQFLSSTGFWWKWGTPGGSSHDLDVKWLEMQPPWK